MRKLIYLIIFSLSLLDLQSCREKKASDKIKDAIEDVGDDIENTVDDI